MSQICHCTISHRLSLTHIGEVKSGFPPKIIPELPGSTPISDAQINLQKGDQLTVERRTRTVHAPAPTKSAPSAPPAPSAPKEQEPGTGKVEDGSVYKLVDGAYLSLKVVPDDNSCLFNSVGCVLMRRSDAATCRELRESECGAGLSFMPTTTMLTCNLPDRQSSRRRYGTTPLNTQSLC